MRLDISLCCCTEICRVSMACTGHGCIIAGQLTKISISCLMSLPNCRTVQGLMHDLLRYAHETVIFNTWYIASQLNTLAIAYVIITAIDAQPSQPRQQQLPTIVLHLSCSQGYQLKLGQLSTQASNCLAANQACTAVHMQWQQGSRLTSEGVMYTWGCCTGGSRPLLSLPASLAELLGSV